MREKIGEYEVIRSLGAGGMGEVLLVSDPKCQREVALKRIRPDLKNRENFKNRFLHEARLTASLTHPGIIAIYNIYSEENELYYTMPFVEGKNLKQILRGKELPIPTLLPIFKSICQTVAYAHSKGYIHRDLKPENILVGNFGEVILLDWGLAESVTNPQGEGEDVDHSPDLTHPGKIVGTLAYMAPERALGKNATAQTDLYALGIILYQLLTWTLPFERVSLKEYRKNFAREKLVDPEEMAPYRDILPGLSRMVRKALAPKVEERYQTMDEFLRDLVNYMEGRSEWFEVATLNIKKKSDWEFQENVLVAKHVAITRGTEEAEWVSLMVSKASFAENTRLEMHVRIDKDGAGIGILLSIPDISERDIPFSGYCLWLGTEDEPFSHLFRNTVEVLHLPDLFLKKEEWHTLIIEKIDNHIRFTLDGKEGFKYVSYLPLVGTHVGILARDDAFQIEKIIASIGSQNLQVSCLAIGDAFLSNKDFKRALAEYRRIGTSFPGHAEGREALFRAGVTLLEQAKNEKNLKKADKLYTLALEEFGKLHTTPGAPLEYLGKALVYESQGDHDEEIKCLELGLRRYQKHPLSHVIKEQIIYRMHESAFYDRNSAYRFILIVLRQLPEDAKSQDSLRLFRSLIAHIEPLPFVENPLEPAHFGKEETLSEKKLATLHFASTLAFWLANPHALLEIFEDVLQITPLDTDLIGNILYFLIELGQANLAERLMQEVKEDDIFSILAPLITCHKKSLSEAIAELSLLNKKDIGTREFASWRYLMEYALRTDQEEKVEKMAKELVPLTLSREDRIELDALRIWAHLALGKIKDAGVIFDSYSPELLNQETTLLHPLYGIYLYATEGEEIGKIHFAGVIETPFPRSWALLGHQIAGHITQNMTWMRGSFLWERRMLYRQLALFYTVTECPELHALYKAQEAAEYSRLS